MSDTLGFFGKLPGYGDFIERNLPRPFTEQWDPWLQRAIQTSRQMLGEHWLDCYLTAPIWRFVLSSGCVDGNAWIGLVMPSVDRVGRHFPLTLAQPLPPQTALVGTLQRNSDWFSQLDSIALACLNESPTVEAVVDVLQKLPAPERANWQGRILDNGAGHSILAQPGANTGNDTALHHAQLLAETLLRQRSASFSLWHSQGSDHNPDTMLACEHMPTPQSFSALLTGQWQEYNWNLIGL